MNLTIEKVLKLLEVKEGEDYFSLRQRASEVYDILIHSDSSFPCVAYWMKGKEVWASNRVEPGAVRIDLEVYNALKPGYLSSKYPSLQDSLTENI